MAIDQQKGVQLACKVIDLAVLKSQLHEIQNSNGAEKQTLRPAAAIDPNAQIAAAKGWVERRQKMDAIESKLKMYDREVEILQKLRHVRLNTSCTKRRY